MQALARFLLAPKQQWLPRQFDTTVDLQKVADYKRRNS